MHSRILIRFENDQCWRLEATINPDGSSIAIEQSPLDDEDLRILDIITKDELLLRRKASAKKRQAASRDKILYTAWDTYYRNGNIDGITRPTRYPHSVEDDILDHKWDKCQGNFVIETGAGTFTIIPSEHWIITPVDRDRIIYCGDIDGAISWALAHPVDHDVVIVNVKDLGQNAVIKPDGAVWRYVQ